MCFYLPIYFCHKLNVPIIVDVYLTYAVILGLNRQREEL